ncbi:hypothetical protein D3C87_1621860 [compost metagenome]
MHIVGHATANHHSGARHQRGGRQLIIAVRNITQACLQVNLAVVAEPLAELAGVGIDRDQASIDGIGQQSALAVGSRGRFGFVDARIAWLSDCLGGIEIGHATATLPDF